MATRIHPKNVHKKSPKNVHEMSPKVSTRCLPPEFTCRFIKTFYWLNTTWQSFWNTLFAQSNKWQLLTYCLKPSSRKLVLNHCNLWLQQYHKGQQKMMQISWFGTILFAILQDHAKLWLSIAHIAEISFLSSKINFDLFFIHSTLAWHFLLLS